MIKGEGDDMGKAKDTGVINLGRGTHDGKTFEEYYKA
jgi:hypothetical protein